MSETRELDAQLTATIAAMRRGRQLITAEIEQLLKQGEEQREAIAELVDELRDLLGELRNARDDVRDTIVDKLVAKIALTSKPRRRKRPS